MLLSGENMKISASASSLHHDDEYDQFSMNFIKHDELPHDDNDSINDHYEEDDYFGVITSNKHNAEDIMAVMLSPTTSDDQLQLMQRNLLTSFE